MLLLIHAVNPVSTGCCLRRGNCKSYPWIIHPARKRQLIFHSCGRAIEWLLWKFWRNFTVLWLNHTVSWTCIGLFIARRSIPHPRIYIVCYNIYVAWWRHAMETFSALLAICAENSPVPGEFPARRPVTRSSDVFFDLRLNKRLSKQSWGWWFETPSRLLWRHRNDWGGLDG